MIEVPWLATGAQCNDSDGGDGSGQVSASSASGRYVYIRHTGPVWATAVEAEDWPEISDGPKGTPCHLLLFPPTSGEFVRNLTIHSSRG